MNVCISIPLKNRLQITISVITVLFWPNITLLKCKYRKVYIYICSNRLLLPSNPYTPSGKNCNNWNCNYRNTNNLQKSLVVSKNISYLCGQHCLSIQMKPWWMTSEKCGRYSVHLSIMLIVGWTWCKRFLMWMMPWKVSLLKTFSKNIKW